MHKRKYGEKRLVFTSAKTWADVFLPQATNLKMAVCVFLLGVVFDWQSQNFNQLYLRQELSDNS